jgi:hypothetical protein
MKNYRDELEAAHQRIAALESALAEKKQERVARPRQGSSQKDHVAEASDVPASTIPPELEKCPDYMAARAAAEEFQAYARGTAIPSRLRWIHRLTALGFLALHAIVSAVILLPHKDGWQVWGIVGFLLPLALASFVGRFTRIWVDPSVGHYQQGNPEMGVGPSVVKYTRRQASVALVVLLLLEGIWTGWALPTLQHASVTRYHPCPRCQTTGSPQR